MKQGSRKLALQRETLVALTPDALDAVAGGVANPSIPQTRGPMCPQSQLSYCPSRISFCPSQPSLQASAQGGGNSQGGGQ
jgi:hypothetical protein